MENEKLFNICAEGYSCEQVDEYLNMLKAEYKKVYEFAKQNEEKANISAGKMAEISDENAGLQGEIVYLEAEKAMLQRRLEESERRQRALTDEAEVQKDAAPVNAEAVPNRSADFDTLKTLSSMTTISEEIVYEIKELRKRLSRYENN